MSAAATRIRPIYILQFSRVLAGRPATLIGRRVGFAFCLRAASSKAAAAAAVARGWRTDRRLRKYDAHSAADTPTRRLEGGAARAAAIFHAARASRRQSRPPARLLCALLAARATGPLPARNCRAGHFDFSGRSGGAVSAASAAASPFGARGAQRDAAAAAAVAKTKAEAKEAFAAAAHKHICRDAQLLGRRPIRRRSFISSATQKRLSSSSRLDNLLRREQVVYLAVARTGGRKTIGADRTALLRTTGLRACKSVARAIRAMQIRLTPRKC